MTIASGMRPRRLRVPTALQDGGTGARTAQEAVAALGVPSLDGDNTFTGTRNAFNGAVVAKGGTIALGADESVLDGSAASGPWAWTLPGKTGTIALTGAVLQVPYVAKSGTASILTSQCVVNCNGTFTVTLPTAVGNSGRFYFIKYSGAGVITMAGTGGQTFDGAASPTVAAGASLTVCSDGANWLIL